MKHDKLGCLYLVLLQLPEPQRGPAAPPHLLLHQHQQRHRDEEPELPAPLRPAPATRQGAEVHLQHTNIQVGDLNILYFKLKSYLLFYTQSI